MINTAGVKAIIVDLDRTLLHTDKTLSTYTVKVLNECKRYGIKIMVATARPLRTTKQYCDLIDLDTIVDATNIINPINNNIVAVINISFTDVSKYLDVYFADCGYGSLKLGTVNLIVGLLTLVINLVITPLIIKRFKPLLILSIFTLLGSIMLVLTFSLPNLILNIYTFYMIFIAAKAIIEPIIVEYLNEHKNIQPGILMGLRQSFISLGGIVGVLIGGIIYAANNVLLFYLCAIMLFVSAVIFIILHLISKKEYSK